MKQFALFLALVGLATTGCTSSRVFSPQARQGGGAMNVAQRQAKRMAPRSSVMKKFLAKSETSQNIQVDNEIELASYGGGRCRAGGGLMAACVNACRGGCDDGCCDDVCCAEPCSDPCCGCDDTCCDSGCCADPCCGDTCGGSGCCDMGCCDTGCSSCGGRGCGMGQRMVGRIASGCCPHAGGYPEAYNFNPSPPSGQVAYPYYTVRGPRDFLRNNPPSIGPY